MAVPQLGIGVVHAWGIQDLVAGALESLDLLEVEPEVTWIEQATEYRADVATRSWLESVGRPIVFHSVGFPFGATEPPPEKFFAAMAMDVARLRPAWISGHLSFNRVGGADGFGCGFLLPAVQSPAGIVQAADNLKRFQDAFALPVAFETGANYLRPRRGEIADGDYFAAVAERADCGILLDLHNVWANERNGRQSVTDVVDRLPPDRVWEMHVAGGTELGGYWIDAHAGLACEELLDLAVETVPRLPGLAAICLEIDAPSRARVPVSAAAFQTQLERLRNIWSCRGTGPPRRFAPARSGGPPGIAPGTWERALGALVVDQPAEGPLAAEFTADPGVQLYRTLISSVRAGVLVNVLSMTCRLLLLQHGSDRLRAVFADYWQAFTPALFAHEEAHRFAHYLQGVDELRHPWVSAVLSLEVEGQRAVVEGRDRTVELDCDPAPIVDALARGTLPERVPRGRFTYTLHAG